MTYEELGLCDHGNAVQLIVDKITFLNGSKPVNTSGGLEAKVILLEQLVLVKFVS
ncbi:thiolase C-terminal domain-containing protein [Alkalihalobacterium elongatum]|uniref:thiolase C-terminal domain-containing protein n=1 Tax=Alkalihalobacterium elongatum TaxID=2675466 RepID=UPI0038B40D41